MVATAPAWAATVPPVEGAPCSPDVVDLELLLPLQAMASAAAPAGRPVDSTRRRGHGRGAPDAARALEDLDDAERDAGMVRLRHWCRRGVDRDVGSRAGARREWIRCRPAPVPLPFPRCALANDAAAEYTTTSDRRWR